MSKKVEKITFTNLIDEKDYSFTINKKSNLLVMNKIKKIKKIHEQLENDKENQELSFELMDLMIDTLSAILVPVEKNSEKNKREIIEECIADREDFEKVINFFSQSGLNVTQSQKQD